MSEAGYNGWSNRATWAVALHINNDEGWQERIHELVRERLAEGQGDDSEVTGVEHAGDDYSAETLQEVADRIERDVTSIVDPLAYVEEFGDTELSTWANGPGLAARDIGDLSEVDWSEIAESFIADIG